MIAILLLASGAALCVSLVLFLILRPKPRVSRKPAGARSAPGRARSPGEVGSGQIARLVSGAPTAAHDRKKLSAAERQEMLEGVKNLAESNPQKVAGLIRDWMNEDETPPRS